MAASGFSWSRVTGGNTITTYTDPAGVTWTAHIFTSSGTLVVTQKGVLDTLCVGGGGGMQNWSGRIARGGAGAVRWGWQEYKELGSYSIVIGGDTSITTPSSTLLIGSGHGGQQYAHSDNGSLGLHGVGGGGSPGGISKNAGTRNGGGAGGPMYGSGETPGIELYYEGSAIDYGRGGQGTSNTSAGWGAGSGASQWSQGGRSGIVVVRYKS